MGLFSFGIFNSYWRKKITAINCMFNEVEPSNPRFLWLEDKLCEQYNKAEWEEITSSTSVFKLNWRMFDEKNAKEGSYFRYLQSLIYE